MLSAIFYFLFYFILVPFVILSEIFLYFFKGEKIIWKIAILLGTGGLLALAVFWPKGLFIPLGAFVIFCILIAFLCAKDIYEQNYEWREDK